LQNNISSYGNISEFGGGGIFNGGTLTVTNCTFSGNSAGAGGGIENSGGALAVTNSTFSGNSATGLGGAIRNGESGTASGTLTVTNCTFSGNSATDGGGGIFTGGAGIYDSNDTLTVTNTILANSTSAGNCAFFSGSVTDGGHNLDDGTSCGFSTANGSLNNTDPRLDPAGLQNNGGPTQTIALEAGSPAINAGDESVCAAPPVNNLDQRGFFRPGLNSTNCSIGAYEYNSFPPCCQCPTSCAAPVAGSCGDCTMVFGATCQGGDLCVLYTPTPTPTLTSTPTVTPTPTITPTATPTPPPGLIPGLGKNACMLEWFTEPATVVGRNGLPVRQLTCTDDNPLCDFGATTGDNTCTFHVALCLNVADTRLRCAPTDVAQVQLVSPNEAKPKGAPATANRDALESALMSIGGTVGGLCANRGPHKGQFCTVNSNCDSTPGSGDGVCKGRFVVFAPPLTTDNSCTVLAPIQVPLRQTTRGFETARATLIVTAIPGAGRREINELTLICKPHP